MASVIVRNRRPSRFRALPVASSAFCFFLREDMRPPAARSCEPKPPFPPRKGAYSLSDRKKGDSYLSQQDPTRLAIVCELGSSFRPLVATRLACCLTCAGSRHPTWLNRCATETSLGIGKHTVGGKSNPAQVVNSTLIVAMVASRPSQQSQRSMLWWRQGCMAREFC